MIPFDEKLGGSTLTSYQEMWANNGDVISKQYAGTAAMKVCLPVMPLSSPNLIMDSIIAGGHYSLWGEKAHRDDEGRLQLCPQILPQRISRLLQTSPHWSVGPPRPTHPRLIPPIQYIDLMQGVNPFEAFVFLPRSMQGMDELEDVGLSSLLSDQPSEAMWSLEKEDVSQPFNDNHALDKAMSL